jgi:hypothetical protein
LALAGNSAWQPWQRRLSGPPHPRQNRAREGFSWPQQDMALRLPRCLPHHARPPWSARVATWIVPANIGGGEDGSEMGTSPDSCSA